MFRTISDKVSLPDLEKEILAHWKRNRIFEKSIEARQSAPDYTFYEGPPTANGKPGIHHVFARTIKDLVCRYQTMDAQKLLDDHPTDDQKRFLYGTSIEAVIRNQLNKLWLLNYSHPDTTMGTHPWGIFVEETGGLRPLYIYKPSDSDDRFVAYFTAAVDLDQDGNDELVVEASYRIGTAFKVISSVGGKYQEISTSYYRGPEPR